MKTIPTLYPKFYDRPLGCYGPGWFCYHKIINTEFKSVNEYRKYLFEKHKHPEE